jgi:hypothetical protein
MGRWDFPVVRRDWVISHGKRFPTKAEALEAANAANERIGKQKQVEAPGSNLNLNQAEQVRESPVWGKGRHVRIAKGIAGDRAATCDLFGAHAGAAPAGAIDGNQRSQFSI